MITLRMCSDPSLGILEKMSLHQAEERGGICRSIHASGGHLRRGPVSRSNISVSRSGTGRVLLTGSVQLLHVGFVQSQPRGGNQFMQLAYARCAGDRRGYAGPCHQPGERDTGG